MVKLGEVCDVRDGTHDSPKYVEYGYPLVTSKNIKDGQLDLSIVNFIAEEDYNKINERSKVDIGDIIMPMIGTIGNPYLVEEICDFAIKNVALIKCDNPKVINRFVWYFLQSNAFERYVDTKNKGGTQKFLSLGDIRAIELPVVSIAEQKDIIETLSLVDCIVAKRKHQLKKLDELVKARFIEMFGDPVTNFYCWEQTTLKDICIGNLTYGSGASACEFDGIIRYIRITDINETGELNSDKVSPGLVENKYILNEGDILFARSGATVGKTYRYKNTDGMCLYAGYLIRLIPDTAKVLPDYIFHYTKTNYYNDFISSNMKVVAQPNINAQQYGGLIICVPPMELQKKFVGFVQQIDKSKLEVQKSLEKLETLKKALMQKYFG